MIYIKNKAKYCVLFLSEDYANRLWTRHELRFAQARAFQESREYILTARFDDTEIPGLLPIIAYINLNDYCPEEFAELIADKVNNRAIGQRADIDPILESRLADAVI